MIGLSITSSWGNGHATTYRSLARGLAARGHRILFLERDLYWYAENRDQPHPHGAVAELYSTFEDLVHRFEAAITSARLVIVGSFVRDGALIGDWVTSVASGKTAFYDIDTPITLAQLQNGEREYVTPELIRRYNAYLSFTGGPVLRFLESHYGSPMARVLHCSVDPTVYQPRDESFRWHLGYLGTYSADRQPVLESLLLEPARRWPQGRFAVVGAMYPEDLEWPPNVDLDIHLSPHEHAAFYGAQRFSLNVTRAEMKKWGHSPSVRLFEAGACAVPVISDPWDGLGDFFEIGKEVLISETPDQTLRYLHDTSDHQRMAIGRAARRRVLDSHTPEHRARQLESYMKEIDDNAAPHTSRTNGHSREVDHRVDAGNPLERGGEGAGAAAGTKAGPFPPRGNIYQPAGTRVGDGGTDRQPSQSLSTTLDRVGGTAHGELERPDSTATGPT
jgi:spore maturation protein CgeB